MERARAMMRRRAAAVGGLAVLLAGCAIEYAPPDTRRAQGARDTDTTVVLAELRSYYRDLSDRNWMLFADHFWDGATITTVWQPPGADTPGVMVTTVPEFVAAAPRGPDSREIFEEVMRDARIRVSGGLAQAWVRYHARFGDPGAVREWDGVDAFTLVEHQGRWRIASLAFRGEGGGP